LVCEGEGEIEAAARGQGGAREHPAEAARDGAAAEARGRARGGARPGGAPAEPVQRRLAQAVDAVVVGEHGVGREARGVARGLAREDRLGEDAPREHRRKDALGRERLREAEAVSLSLYKTAADHALRAGIIIADTKFELGIDSDGNLVLGDEALTPDSSRFWPGETYEPGRAQESFDKQFVRDYCETTGWDKTDPGPELPHDVVQVTRKKYHEAFERLTTIPFPAYLDDPGVVLG